MSINVNAYLQTKTLSNKLDVMDPYEFVLMQYEYERQRSSNPTGFLIGMAGLMNCIFIRVMKVRIGKMKCSVPIR